MKSSFLDNKFSISVPDLILHLEQSGLLINLPAEHSDLRRLPGPPLPLVWDSRKLTDGETCIFFPKKIRAYNGYKLVESLLCSNCYVVGEWDKIEEALTELNRPLDWVKEIKRHPCLCLVKNAEEALDQIILFASKVDRQRFTLISVTGTNGKTSVTEIVRQGLQKLSTQPVASVGTLGVKLGTCSFENPYPTMPDYPGFLSVLKEANALNIQQIVFESTSIGLAENRLGRFQVDVAAFTNLTQDHLDYHKSMIAYEKAKAKLFTHHLKEHGWAVVHAFNNHWKNFCEYAKGPNRKLIVVGPLGIKDEAFSLYAKEFQLCLFLSLHEQKSTRTGVQFECQLHQGRTKPLSTYVNSGLLGAFQIDNLSVAMGMLLALGYPLDAVARSFTHIEPVPGRLDPVGPLTKQPSLSLLPKVSSESQTQQDKFNLPTVLVDYAHSPDALEKTLKTCREMMGHTKGKLVLVFGCGGNRDAGKRPLMGRIAVQYADTCIVTSDNPRTEDPMAIISDICQGIPKENLDKSNFITEADRSRAIELAINHASASDLVLIAGKGHEAYQIVGHQTLPFNDKDVATQVLLSKKNQK